MSSGFGDLFSVLRESAATSLASFDVAVSSSCSVSFESSDFSGPRLFRLLMKLSSASSSEDRFRLFRTGLASVDDCSFSAGVAGFERSSDFSWTGLSTDFDFDFVLDLRLRSTDLERERSRRCFFSFFSFFSFFDFLDFLCSSGLGDSGRSS